MDDGDVTEKQTGGASGSNRLRVEKGPMIAIWDEANSTF